MLWIFLLALFALSTSHDLINLEDSEEINEIVVAPFNKCSRDSYYDLYQARCSPCTLCKPGEFEVQDCNVFDNRICSTCESRIYAHTLPHILKCVFARQQGYEILDGLKGKVEEETPYKLLENDHLLASDEVGTDEINEKIKELFMEYTNDNNVEDSAPVSDEDIELNSVEIVENNVVPQIDELIEFDDSDDEDSDEDSEEEEMVSIADAQSVESVDYVRYLRLMRIYLFIGAAAFVSLLLSAFYCCRVSRTERTFAIIEPPTSTPEEHHVLVRSLAFVKNKHRGFFKYEPLEEFV